MTWAEVYHDVVPIWLRPYARLYAKHGYDLDDLAQEGRTALVEQEAYLVKLDFEGGVDRVRAAAKTLVLRAVKRRLLGRSAGGKAVFDTGPAGWEVLFDVESREHSVEIQLELAEAVANAPAAVKMYLRELLSEDGLDGVQDPKLKKIHKQAADYLLSWFVSKHNWRHES